MKKFVGYLMIIILFAGSIAGIYFGIRFKISQDELANYSESIQIIEDLKNKLEIADSREEEITASLLVVTQERDGYKQDVQSLTIQINAKDERISELETKAEEDKISIANLTAEKTRLENELATSEEENTTKQAKIEELNGRISEFETNLSNTQSAKAEIEAERDQLQSDKTALEAQIAQANERINSLEADKLALQNEVSRLTDLLAGYDDIKNGTFEVGFYIKGVHYTTKVVKNGASVQEIERTSDTNEYRFDGWSLDKINAVDPTTVAITENTTFYALITPKFAVKFKDDENVETQYVLQNDVPNVQSLTKEGYEFLGWSEYGTDVVSDISTRPVTADIEYTAVWVQKFTVQYMDGTTTLNTESVTAGNKATFPTAPTKSGWTFAGWYNNGVKVTTSNFKPTENVVLKAQYSKWDVISTTTTAVTDGKANVSSLQVNTEFRATFELFTNYYIDWDGYDFNYSYSNILVTSGITYRDSNAGHYGSGEYTISISCTQNGVMNVVTTTSTHSSPEFTNWSEFDEYTIESIKLTKVEVKSYMYNL